MTVSVLTTGYWPSYKSLDLTLPQEMIDALSQFKVRLLAPPRRQSIVHLGRSLPLGKCGVCVCVGRGGGGGGGMLLDWLIRQWSRESHR